MADTNTINDNSVTKGISVRKTALIGMFGAIAAVLMFIEMPIPVIAPPFYKIDFSEVPVLIGTFAMGPVAGILIELIKILLHLLPEGGHLVTAVAVSPHPRIAQRQIGIVSHRLALLRAAPDQPVVDLLDLLLI